MRPRGVASSAILVIVSIIHTSVAYQNVARPALRLGGEWAGKRKAFPVVVVDNEEQSHHVEEVEELISEVWTRPEGADACLMARRTIRLRESVAPEITNTVLPGACSDSIILQPGNSMFEPETLNARAWALDAVAGEDGTWTCETIFDGLGGARPAERADALECPAERTRVSCHFDVATGDLKASAPVLVWQERCWSASPADDLEERITADQGWVDSVVGYEELGGRASSSSSPLPSPTTSSSSTSSSTAEEDEDEFAGAPALLVGGGIELRGKPGLLEVTLRSGRNSRQRWSRIVVRRSWVGGEGGRSVFANVAAYDETDGDD